MSPTNPATASEPVVTRNDEKGRYEIWLDDLLAGFTDFHRDSRDRLVFDHTLIDHAFGGRGLGTILVAGAMTDVARHGETIVPVCPFVTRYLEQNEVPGLSIAWRDGRIQNAVGSASA